MSGEVDTPSCAMCFLFGVLASHTAKPDMVQRRTNEQVLVPRSCTKVIEGLVVNRISDALRRRRQDQIHCSRSAGRCWRRNTNVFPMIWEGQTSRQERCERTNFESASLLTTLPRTRFLGLLRITRNEELSTKQKNLAKVSVWISRLCWCSRRRHATFHDSCPGCVKSQTNRKKICRLDFRNRA